MLAYGPDLAKARIRYVGRDARSHLFEKTAEIAAGHAREALWTGSDTFRVGASTHKERREKFGTYPALLPHVLHSILHIP
jgi:hypothetical protein